MGFTKEKAEQQAADILRERPSLWTPFAWCCGVFLLWIGYRLLLEAFVVLFLIYERLGE